MSLIISLETTTKNCSVALAKNGKLLSIQEYHDQKYSHAEKLHSFIKQTTLEAGFSLKELSAVAVSQGPGSYTGLRIGVSAAKGLCFALDIPLLAIDTLECIARQVNQGERYRFIIPLLDARRMEVFTSVFDQNFKKITPTTAKILTEDAYSSYLDRGKTLFIGNAVEKFKNICTHKNAFFVETLPSAREMVLMAEEDLKQGNTVDVAYFEPFYLKDFIVSKKATS